VTDASNITHKVSSAHQDDIEANDSAAAKSSSVWKRLHGEHRNDVIPSSCSVSFYFSLPYSYRRVARISSFGSLQSKPCPIPFLFSSASSSVPFAVDERELVHVYR